MAATGGAVAAGIVAGVGAYLGMPTALEYYGLDGALTWYGNKAYDLLHSSEQNPRGRRKSCLKNSDENNDYITVFHYETPGKKILNPGTWVTTVGGLSWDRAISITYLTSPENICEYTAIVDYKGVAWENWPVMGLPQGRLTLPVVPSNTRIMRRPK